MDVHAGLSAMKTSWRCTRRGGRSKTSPFSSPSTLVSRSISKVPASLPTCLPFGFAHGPERQVEGRQAGGCLILVRELVALGQTGPCPEPLDPAKAKKCAGIPRGVYCVRLLGAKMEISVQALMSVVWSLSDDARE